MASLGSCGSAGTESLKWRSPANISGPGASDPPSITLTMPNTAEWHTTGTNAGLGKVIVAASSTGASKIFQPCKPSDSFSLAIGSDQGGGPVNFAAATGTTVSAAISSVRRHRNDDNKRASKVIDSEVLRVPLKYRQGLWVLLDDTRPEVLKEVETGPASVADLSKRVGLSRSAMRHRLELLNASCIIQKKGVFRPRYEANPDATAWLKAQGQESEEDAT